MRRYLKLKMLLLLCMTLIVNRCILFSMNSIGLAITALEMIFFGNPGIWWICAFLGMVSVLPIKIVVKYTLILFAYMLLYWGLKVKYRKKIKYFAPLILGGITFFIGNAFSVLYEPNLYPFYEVILCNLFESICTGIIMFVGILVFEKRFFDDSKMDLSEDQILLEIRKQMYQFSKTFKKLAESFQNTITPRLTFSDEEKNDICRDVTQNLCMQCSRKEICWEKNQYYTWEATHQILDDCMVYGQLERPQMPAFLRQQCIHISEFLKESKRAIDVAKMNLDWRNRLIESRVAVASQLNDVGDMIERFGMELSLGDHKDNGYEEKIKKELSGRKMHVKEVKILRNKKGRIKVYLCAKMKVGRYCTAREICKLLSDLYKKNFILGKDCRMVISKSYRTYEFVEDMPFKTIEGIAIKSKSGEKVSGDDYMVLHLENGQTVLSVSDGMGSGESAAKESKYILQLLEAMLESGFHKFSTVRLLNALMFLKSDRQMYSTIDIVLLDLFDGKANFIKVGGCSSYIKYQDHTEEIASETLPAGAFSEIDCKEMVKDLKHQCYLIMVSDGIFQYRDNLEIKTFINGLNIKNPQEMAELILKFAMEKDHLAKDDITVLVSCIIRTRRQ